MRMIPAAITAGVVAAGGLLWFGQANPALSSDGPVPGCGFVYGNGIAYPEDMPREWLRKAPKEVRKLLWNGAWVIVLEAPTTRRPTAAERQGFQEFLASAKPVTEPAQVADAVRFCVEEPGHIQIQPPTGLAAAG